MKVLLNNEKTKNKDLYFEEGFWTGKRKIVYDGITLTKLKEAYMNTKTEMLKNNL